VKVTTTSQPAFLVLGIAECIIGNYGKDDPSEAAANIRCEYPDRCTLIKLITAKESSLQNADGSLSLTPPVGSRDSLFYRLVDHHIQAAIDARSAIHLR
jgi:hypothetical protein